MRATCRARAGDRRRPLAPSPLLRLGCPLRRCVRPPRARRRRRRAAGDGDGGLGEPSGSGGRRRRAGGSASPGGGGADQAARAGRGEGRDLLRRGRVQAPGRLPGSARLCDRRRPCVLSRGGLRRPAGPGGARSQLAVAWARPGTHSRLPGLCSIAPRACTYSRAPARPRTRASVHSPAICFLTRLSPSLLHRRMVDEQYRNIGASSPVRLDAGAGTHAGAWVPRTRAPLDNTTQRARALADTHRSRLRDALRARSHTNKHKSTHARLQVRTNGPDKSRL